MSLDHKDLLELAVTAPDELKKAIKKIKARRSLLNFILYTKEDYQVNWHHKLMCDELDDFLANPKRTRLIVQVGPRRGKQFSLSTPVLTSKGWKKHGELKVGDYVFNHHGKQVKVEAVGAPCVSDTEISFTTGETFQTHGNHEWLFYRSSKPARIFETKNLGRLNDGEVGKRGSEYLYRTPTIDPLESDYKLEIDPYLFGYWLGNGKKDRYALLLSCHSDFLHSISESVCSAGYSIDKTYIQRGTNTGYVRFLSEDFKKYLINTKQMEEKHFPEELYLLNKEQRLQLLAGLIDSDGMVGTTGRLGFANTNESIVEGFVHLVRSFGWWPSIHRRESQLSSSGIQGVLPVYEIRFIADTIIPLRIEGKKSRLKTKNKVRRVAVTKVEKKENLEMGNCIQVEGGIYLIGKTLVPTHNSEIISRRLPAYIFGRNPNTQIIATSYGAELAQAMNRDVQRIIDSPEYQELFPATRLSGKNVKTTSLGNYVRTSDKFEIVGYRGVYRSAGVGGGITGQGADCFKGDTPVLTENGYVKISDLMGCEGVIKVASLNHETGEVQFKRIIATQRKRTDKVLVEFQTLSGRSFICTSDHPVYTKERGYKKAKFFLGRRSSGEKGIKVKQNLYRVHTSLQYLPHDSTQVQDESISSVTEIGRTEEFVYDIQVEGNNNFFADGILVHNCAIIDDPFKDWAEASSAKRRQLIKDWYNSTLYTRLAPLAKVIVVNTRWHQDDLSGFLLKEAEVNPRADQWEVISLPEIQDEHNDYPHPKDMRENGDVLWPTRFGPDLVDKIMNTVGSKIWTSLYQQRPSPDGGQIFKSDWLQYYDEPPAFEYLAASWDCAFKETATSDYVVGQVWGVCGSNKYLIYMVRERLDIIGSIREMLKVCSLFKLRYTLVEDKANGPAIISMLKNKIPSLIPFNPEGSKEARANAVAPQFEAGNIWLPNKYHEPNRLKYSTVISLLDDYVNELKAFPNGANDDMVDATTQILLKVGHSVQWLDELIEKAQNGSTDDNKAEYRNKVADAMGWNMEESDSDSSFDDLITDDFFKLDK